MRIKGEAAGERGLREAMIAELWRLDAVRTQAVAGAFARARRPMFVPEAATVAQVYETENAVVTRLAPDGAAGLIGPHVGTATVLDPETGAFGYLVNRPRNPELTSFEFGDVAHGPTAKQVAETFIEATCAWDRQARGNHARFTAAPIPSDPAGRAIPPHPPAGDPVVAARVVERPFHRFIIDRPTN